MLTRRQATMVTLAAAGTAGWSNAFAATVTAAEVVARIRRNFGARWTESQVDGFAAGDPQLRVTGVAVTVMPSMATLRAAVAHGCNLIISPESPLYARPNAIGAPGPSSAAETIERLRADPTYTAKQAYIAQHKLAIYRLDENLRAAARRPLVDGIATIMGWRGRRDPANDQIFVPPPTTLNALAGSVKHHLGINGGMRLIGHGDMPVKRVLVVPGRIDPVAVVKLLPQVDVLLTGDLREWELVEYFHDSWETSAPKALIAVGRILSEQPGVIATASWLRPMVGLPVRPIHVQDPYWRLPA